MEAAAPAKPSRAFAKAIRVARPGVSMENVSRVLEEGGALAEAISHIAISRKGWKKDPRACLARTTLKAHALLLSTLDEVINSYHVQTRK